MDLVGRYADMYRDGSSAPKEYRRWLAARVLPLLRAHGLDRPPRLDPATGVVRAIGGLRGERRGLIAAELGPVAAAQIQPTLF